MTANEPRPLLKINPFCKATQFSRYQVRKMIESGQLDRFLRYGMTESHVRISPDYFDTAPRQLHEVTADAIAERVVDKLMERPSFADAFNLNQLVERSKEWVKAS